MLDHRLAAAADELRSEVDNLDPPAFKPNRSAAPAVFIMVLLLGIGIVGLVGRARPDDSGGISVATQPDVSQPADTELPTDGDPSDDPSAEPGSTDPTPTDSDSPDSVSPGDGPDGSPAGEATPLSRWRTIASPASGEFYMPLPSADAWSPDESRIIVYRTGSAQPGHLVYDTFDAAAEPIALPFVPADIEQVYWHPLETDRVLYTAGPELLSFDLVTLETRTEHSFAACESVDSGVAPVSPANDGTVSLLCRSDGEASVSQVTYNLETGQVQQAPTTSDTAAAPSPSGEVFVQWNLDGSASVLDRTLGDTGVVLDLRNNRFGFVTDPLGGEWVAATLFDGPYVGTIVVLPLDGIADPIVLIGPDRGDPYPPSGTLLSTSGDKIVVSIRGEDDGLAGRLTLLDLADSFVDPERRSRVHGTAGLHEYWSSPFVSVSRSGVVAYSTDAGGDSVNTWVGNFIDDTEASD